MRKVLLRIAVGAVVVLAGVYYWELAESPSPQGQFELNISEVRRLANSLPGPKPVDMRVESVADFRWPTGILVAGGGLHEETMGTFSYQLVYPEHTVILDTAMNEAQGKEMGTVSAFRQDAFDRMIAGMTKAQTILLTHEHPDHMGGLAAHSELVHLARLTREQITNPKHTLPARFSDYAFSGYEPLEYDHYLAAAPGVVLIKAPGHSLGSQMVYVQREDGGEVLFLGDVAWIVPNLMLLRERPRLITTILDEDRGAVMRQLAAVQALMRVEPKLVIVPGHDANVVADLVSRGVLRARFQ